MSAAQDAINTIAFKVISTGVKDLLPVAEGAMPLPVEMLVKGLLALPPVQALETKLEQEAANAVGDAMGAVEAEAQRVADSFLRAHPALESLWQKLDGASALGAVTHFAVDEVRAFLALQKSGRWGEVRGFLQQAGVLPA